MDDEVVVVGEDLLSNSNDAGKTWRANVLDTEESPKHISCGPDNELWVAACFSVLLRSSDQGQTWQQTSFESK